MGDRVRRIALANVALFVSAVVGLVTVDDGPDDVLVAAARATGRSGTAAFSVEVSIDVGGHSNRSSGTGRIDFARKRFAITFQGIGPSETINDNGVVYVRTGGTGRTPWVALDRGQAGASFPVDGGLGGDPLLALDVLRRDGVVRDVRRLGREDVRGTPTTHWEADLDSRKLATISPQNRDLIDSVGIREMRYSLWLDDDGVVRRFRIVTEATAISSTATTELYDFGVAAPIEVPPPDQVERVDLRRPTR